MSSSYVQSLSSTRLDALLHQHGAATFGSTERKRQRLQRFLDSQFNVPCRGEEEPPLKRRRITTESCPSPASVRRPAPPALPNSHRMVTRSARRNSRVAAQNAMDRIRSVIAEFLA